MTNKLTVLKAALALALALLAAPAQAATCALDDVPAATLLLPYFEVDLANANGRTTLFSINNSKGEAALARVTLWTDLAVPTLAFDVYLTGFDIQTINLRDIFIAGRLPRTADDINDPTDTISPQGDFSQDFTFQGCRTALPYPPLPFQILDHIRSAHTGGPSAILQGACSGTPSPGVARGYVTVDVVRRCSLLNPTEAGYFGPDGVAGSDNVLWGDYFFVDPDGRFAHGENLVRIEADPTAFQPGDATFYGGYVGYSATDAREPLANSWATRYLRGGAFSGGTDLVVWRDLGRPPQTFACGSQPNWQPLPQGRVTFFDEEETSQELEENFPTSPPLFSAPPVFHFAAGKVGVDIDLSAPFDFGWLFLDLGHPGTQGPSFSQSWVGTVFSAEGIFSAGMEATALDSSCSPDRCLQGEAADVGRICLRGPVQAGQNIVFDVYPKGCFSSSCTRIHKVTCSTARAGSELRLDPLVCLSPTGFDVCTPDCSGGGSAVCQLHSGLPAGSYTARAGDLQLAFTVPMPVPAEGHCVGTQL